MGNKCTKSSLRNAIIYLNISADQVGAHDDKFWSQIWTEDVTSADEIIKSISTREIRMLRDGSPRNFAILTYKMVERLCLATGTLCNSYGQQTAVLNATRILIRLIPCIFEDKLWQNFFIENCIDTANGLRQEPHLVYPEKSEAERDYESYLPCRPTEKSPSPRQTDVLLSKNCSPHHTTNYEINLLDPDTNQQTVHETSCNKDNNLMKTLILSTCDLLYCPEFTVLPLNNSYLSGHVDAPPEDLKSLATCDYVWEPGVGFDSDVNSTSNYDKARSELLRLLLACLSPTLYKSPENSIRDGNLWIEIFASTDNRHALPLFTSLLNTVFVYRASNFTIFDNFRTDDRKELVELSIQILIVTLDYSFGESEDKQNHNRHNLFIEYMTRIHRVEDFKFLIKGFARLLNNRFEQGYILNSKKYVNFEHELLILFWRIINLNKRFMNCLMKTDDILDIVIPMLYHLNENFQDPSKSALIHIGVFNLLILSGERNFGVRLNKAYTANLLTNLPSFTGSHGDLIIIVFHKLILYGYNLNQLYDFLMTILVNISPYLKSLCMLSSKCLFQLFETFSSPYVIFTEPNYHQIVIFLLEIFNNLIQYQFDGNVNMVYVVLNKKETFSNLANLTTTQAGIDKILNKLIKQKQKLKLLENTQTEEPINDDPSDDSHLPGAWSNPVVTNHLLTHVATVSSDQSPSRSDAQSARQEVSLVATPDLCQVTREMYPFNHVNEQTSSRSESATTSTKSCMMSFDDILDQGSDQPDTCREDTSSSSDENAKQAEDILVDKSDSSAVNNDSKWKPTPEWVKQWKQLLPIHTVLRMIEVLVPQIEQLKQENAVDQLDEAKFIKHLQSGTLVGLLPVPHPILIRKYRTNDETILWFRSCTWAIVYVRNTIWTDTDVQLVRIF